MRLAGLLSNAPTWIKSLAEKLGPREELAAAYGYTICRSEGGCDPWVSFAAAAARLGAAPRGLPSGAEKLVSKALAEAEEAYLRSPQSIYAQIALDSEALAYMGSLGLLLPPRRGGLDELLGEAMQAMSYAAASDYILYTRTAKRLAGLLKPHTLATAKWLTEELGLLGVKAVPRTEATAAGIVAYLDLRSCPCGSAEKTTMVKPMPTCMKYVLEYRCCGEKLRAEICTPESTRTR